MKRRFSLPGCLLFVSVVAGTNAAEKVAIVPPAKRAETVELAQSLTKPATPPALGVGNLRSPFANAQPAAPAPVAQPAGNNGFVVEVSSDFDLLRKMAPLVNPSGTIFIEGEPILLFGQKKLRVGDTLPVFFEGKPYELVVSAIERTTFTLRLNSEELTRPIKPGSTP